MSRYIEMLHNAIIKDDFMVASIAVRELVITDTINSICNRHGDTYLISCVTRHAVTVADLLVSAGCDVNVKNKHGHTALMEAAKHGLVDTLDVLISSGANLNATSQGGWSALMFATDCHQPKVAKSLISAGADVNIQDDQMVTALEIAQMRGYTDMIDLLTAHGAVICPKDTYAEIWS